MKLNIKYIGLLFCLGLMYPICILSYVWLQVLNSPFQGGRNGPLDAYRHTLASAVVAFTLSPLAVECVTVLMERGNTPSNMMDRHNNRIGAIIGQDSDSLFNLQTTVEQAVRTGNVNANNANQITWLPKKDWLPGKFW